MVEAEVRIHGVTVEVAVVEVLRWVHRAAEEVEVEVEVHLMEEAAVEGVEVEVESLRSEVTWAEGAEVVVGEDHLQEVAEAEAAAAAAAAAERRVRQERPVMHQT